MRFKSSCMVGACLATFCLLGSATVSAQVVGDQVTPLAAIDLKIKDQVIESVKPDDVLKVEKVQDDWIWVATASNKRGWLMKSDVKAFVAKPATTPADMPPATTPSATPSTTQTPGSIPMPPRAVPVPGKDQPVDERLYLIGAMGATQVYLSYAYIGAIGDGYVNKSYDQKKVEELMGEVSGMSTHLVTQLKKVNEGDLTPEDREAITQMIDINELLKKEAEALTAYTKSPTAQNAEAFDSVRVEVWPKIAKLLGIAGESEQKPAEKAP